MDSLPPPYGPAFQPGGGVIFDMDGLMLDTEAIFKLAWQHAAKVGGHELSDDLFCQMIGRNAVDSAALLTGAFGPEFDLAAFRRDCALFNEGYVREHGVPTKPGLFELIEYLRRHRIPMAVATSTARPETASRLQRTELASLFSVVVTGDEIERGKPAPDIYLKAARELGVDPARSLALEDSPAGTRSAHVAGMQVIIVPDLIAPPAEIVALALRVFPSLHEVKAYLERRSSPRP